VERSEVELTQIDLEGKVERRILVLGSAPHTKTITAYTWDNLPKRINVADYDVVILNLVPFLEKQFARSVKLETLPGYEQFAQLLFSDASETIAIGNPSIEIGSNPYQRITWWLPPIFPKFSLASGEAIRSVVPEFNYYFKNVKRWYFHTTSQFNRAFHYNDYLPFLHPIASNLHCQVAPVAQTRYKRPIAFRLMFQAVFENTEGIQEKLKESGSIIWLPPTTEISDYEAVNLILRERYNLSLEDEPPTWAERFRLPLQIPIETNIFHLQQEIKQLEEKLIVAQQELEGAVQFRKLLYEQGVDGLEPVVRDALRELGAFVDDPPPKENREDGRLVDPTGRKGMLEIKGRTKSISLADVRQLDQWVRDALLGEENWESKGIFIANTYCDRPPEQRGDPFPSNCIEKAKIANQCLITTTQLFLALCSHQKGELDIAAFWNTVFGTDGVCSLPEMERPEVAGE